LLEGEKRVLYLVVHAPEFFVEADFDQHLLDGVGLQDFESLLLEFLLNHHVFEAVHGVERFFQLVEDIVLQ
jgi:hypothetical protein